MPLAAHPSAALPSALASFIATMLLLGFLLWSLARPPLPQPIDQTATAPAIAGPTTSAADDGRVETSSIQVEYDPSSGQPRVVFEPSEPAR